MAFDMYAGDLHEAIHPSEEILLQMASESPERYPELTRLWEAFYEDPELTSAQAGELVHELIEFNAENGAANAAISHSVHRLLPFFSRAYRHALTVRCRSD